MSTFQQFSLAVNTRRSYNTAHNTYLRFCSYVGLDPLTPATERELCLLLVYYCRSHKLTTLPTFLAGVAHYYKLNHMPLHRDALFHSVRRGIANYLGLSQHNTPKAALSWSQLTSLVDHLLLSPSSATAPSFDATRDVCLYLFCFYGLFRGREVLGEHFQWQHVTRHNWGIQVVIPFSKTNNQPVSVRMVSRNDAYCPARAFDAYHSSTPAPLRLGTLPFFRASPSRSTPLTYASALSVFKHRVRDVLHSTADHYGWHSFRRGGTTAMFHAGVPDSLIALQGRWASLTYRRYFDNTQHHTMATSMLLQATRPCSS